MGAGGTGSELSVYGEASARFLRVLNSLSLNKAMTSPDAALRIPTIYTSVYSPFCLPIGCSGTTRIPLIVPQRIHESQSLSPHHWLSSSWVHVKGS